MMAKYNQCHQYKGLKNTVLADFESIYDTLKNSLVYMMDHVLYKGNFSVLGYHTSDLVH